jgi:hypothetical protein
MHILILNGYVTLWEHSTQIIVLGPNNGKYISKCHYHVEV